MQTESRAPIEEDLAQADKVRKENALAAAEERRERVKGFRPENYSKLFVRADTTQSEDRGGVFVNIKKAPASDIGRYGENNGVLAFATANGDYYIADPKNLQVKEILDAAGFAGDGVTVPHSNDGGRWFKVNVLRQSLV